MPTKNVVEHPEMYGLGPHPIDVGLVQHQGAAYYALVACITRRLYFVRFSSKAAHFGRSILTHHTDPHTAAKKALVNGDPLPRDVVDTVFRTITESTAYSDPGWKVEAKNGPA